MGLYEASYTFELPAPSYEVLARRVCELAGRDVRFEMKSPAHPFETDEERRQKHPVRSKGFTPISYESMTFHGTRRLCFVDVDRSIYGDEPVVMGNDGELLKLIDAAMLSLGGQKRSPRS
jgi:hypothetical protein